ncbi:tRNA 2-selenouridine(34) synthase MnmH [Hydrogenimonas cancrithermarum]|uniref:tRNA 2-selenouridine synthase n=1 Tax=Hydrogenimonas cancrithermarum TaxID=2993563 RepID=A0ABN6WRM4_9BACT|nr:tRNA 2-selenouridine(34) synthase MnmH [Hydrogenimonas cancrithermarum]BDY11721.1 tRNA 2-selenouridine synthase [Hydrogenimonas cancrithermarum]
MAHPLFDDFRQIVLQRRSLIDVRAPVEFAKGAFPNAVNLPLMDDEERRLVGIRYKEKGNAEAVELGHRLVSGEVKKKRVQAWCDFIDTHPDALLYCFRGGQRSQISQQWIDEAGYEIARLRGGYKAFRRYLIEETERAVGRFEPVVLGGRTGSGKTILLRELDNTIDLEGLANHRGSSFGRKITPQPSQIDFENALAYELVTKLEAGYRRLVFEDEGRNVGRVYLPDLLAEFLGNAPLVVLETPMSRRVEITFEEYVTQAQNDYRKMGFPEPLQAWKADIQSAIDRIYRRLGGKRHAIVSEMLELAFSEQSRTGEREAHKTWVEYLLREYYDPMYDYQIEKRAERVIFRGDADEVEAFLKQRA